MASQCLPNIELCPRSVSNYAPKAQGHTPADLTFSNNALRTPDLAQFPVGNTFLNSRAFSMHSLWRERFGHTVKNVGSHFWGVEDEHIYERWASLRNAVRTRELSTKKQEFEPHFFVLYVQPI